MSEQCSARPAHGGARSADDLATRLAYLARSMQEKEDVQATLDAIVHAAVDTIPGAQHASLSVIKSRREVVTRASTNDLPRALDQAQYDTGQGPCLDTLFQQQTVRVNDLDAEQRWPDFIERAKGLGAGSMLVVQLYVNGDRGDLGGLNLSNESKEAFSEESEQVALVLAAHAAVAMSDAQETEHLRKMVSRRDLIGMAKGVLVERHKMTPDQAFALLSRASQESNRKLLDVAEELVHTGQFSAAAKRAPSTPTVTP